MAIPLTYEIAEMAMASGRKLKVLLSSRDSGPKDSRRQPAMLVGVKNKRQVIVKPDGHRRDEVVDITECKIWAKGSHDHPVFRRLAELQEQSVQRVTVEMAQGWESSCEQPILRYVLPPRAKWGDLKSIGVARFLRFDSEYDSCILHVLKVIAGFEFSGPVGLNVDKLWRYSDDDTRWQSIPTMQDVAREVDQTAKDAIFAVMEPNPEPEPEPAPVVIRKPEPELPPQLVLKSQPEAPKIEAQREPGPDDRFCCFLPVRGVYWFRRSTKGGNRSVSKDSRGWTEDPALAMTYEEAPNAKRAAGHLGRAFTDEPIRVDTLGRAKWLIEMQRRKAAPAPAVRCDTPAEAAPKMQPSISQVQPVTAVVPVQGATTTPRSPTVTELRTRWIAARRQVVDAEELLRSAQLEESRLRAELEIARSEGTLQSAVPAD